MLSRWSHLKQEALTLRENGTSITRIESSLKIPRSTLNGWFKTIQLSNEQKQVLLKNKLLALKNARLKTILWHNSQKANRLRVAEIQEKHILSKLNLNDNTILELALAMLYLGEGFKGNQTGLGSSDPLILNFFITILTNVYTLDRNKIRCELHLRADQNPKELKVYWSKILNIPLSKFTYCTIDKRTINIPTYSTYKGVCSVVCGNVAIQRKLVYLSQRFCEIVNQRAVSSVGRASH